MTLWGVLLREESEQRGGGNIGKRMCGRQVMRYKKFKKLPPVAAKRQFLLHKSKYFQLLFSASLFVVCPNQCCHPPVVVFAVVVALWNN